jgi:FkbM family methyltransferase
MDELTKVRRITRGNISFNVTIAPGDKYLQDSWTDYETGLWENWSFEMLDKHIRESTTFMDVGSWLGFMSLHVASRANRVIAYEADPIAFKCVSRNIAANPEWKHVSAINAFVSDRTGKQKVSSLHKGNNSGTTGIIDLGGESWDVPSVDFLDEIKAIPPSTPLFIKMDIEGAEYRVLKRCGRTLASRPNTCLLLSLHPTILAQTVPGRSIIAKARRRIRLFFNHYSLAYALKGFRDTCTPKPHLSPLRRAAIEVMKRGNLPVDLREILLVNA